MKSHKFNFLICRKREVGFSEIKPNGKFEYFYLDGKCHFFGTRSNAIEILKIAKQTTTKLYNNAWKIYKLKLL